MSVIADSSSEIQACWCHERIRKRWLKPLAVLLAQEQTAGGGLVLRRACAWSRNSLSIQLSAVITIFTATFWLRNDSALAPDKRCTLPTKGAATRGLTSP